MFVISRIKKLFVFLQAIVITTMNREKITEEQEQLARFAKALGHPIRVSILQMLAKQICCCHCDMSELLPIAKSTLSQHLNELKDAGLIHGTVTLPTVKYFINRKNWELAMSLFDTLLTEVNNSKACC